jgi:hypothetical protein
LASLLVSSSLIVRQAIYPTISSLQTKLFAGMDWTMGALLIALALLYSSERTHGSVTSRRETAQSAIINCEWRDPNTEKILGWEGDTRIIDPRVSPVRFQYAAEVRFDLLRRAIESFGAHGFLNEALAKSEVKVTACYDYAIFARGTPALPGRFQDDRQPNLRPANSTVGHALKPKSTRMALRPKAFSKRKKAFRVLCGFRGCHKSHG